MNEIVVSDNTTRSRYEAVVSGEVAGYAVYRRDPGRITFVHTVVEPAYEGRGIGGRLARTSLDAARAAGDVVVPICPFYISWLRKHPDYVDIVAAEHRTNVTDS